MGVWVWEPLIEEVEQGKPQTTKQSEKKRGKTLGKPV